jgi:hypothetical protein
MATLITLQLKCCNFSAVYFSKNYETLMFCQINYGLFHYPVEFNLIFS